MNLTVNQRMVGLLSTYVDALEDRELDDQVRESAHNGARLLLFGPLWHSLCPKRCPNPGVRCQSPYAKLEVLLRLLRRERPDLYWHTTGRYVYCERRPHELVRRGVHYLGVPKNARVVDSSVVVDPGDGFWRQEKRNRKMTVRALVETWDEGVDLRKADEGVAWLAQRFPGELSLPRPIYEQLAA